MAKVRENLITAVVFFTGAIVLIVEIVAIRVLSPFYGNTIFTFSSVIAIILGALSFGYYFGGRVADKFPYLEVFFQIILFSGLILLFSEIIILSFLPGRYKYFSIKSGPIFWSIFLFFSPAFLLGFLSPFAIKLKEKYFPKKEIGKISGEIFFWSTIGSILGSLVCGFFLIPNLGVNIIITICGIGLFLIGFFGVITFSDKKKLIFFSILFFLFLLEIFIIFYILKSSQDNNILYKKDGVYEKIIIYDEKIEGRPVRFLQQDLSHSSAIYLDSKETFFDYQNYLKLYKISETPIKNALFLGGGGYVMPYHFSIKSPKTNIDIVEIEPSLYELSKKYFYFKDKSNIKNYVEDGRVFLAKNQQKYDYIFSDAYKTVYSIPVHFTTEEFFKLVKEKLNPNGLFLINVIGKLDDSNPPSFLFSEIKTFKKVFPNNYFFAISSKDNKKDFQNIIFLAINGDKKIDFLTLKKADDPFISSLENNLLDLDNFDFSKEIILTDDFSPVESLLAKEL